MSGEELSDAESYFHRVDARIVPPKPGIRDVQVAGFQTPIVFRREDVSTKRGGRGEVHVVRSRGQVVVGE